MWCVHKHRIFETVTASYTCSCKPHQGLPPNSEHFYTFQFTILTSHLRATPGSCKKPRRKRHYIAMLLTKPHWYKSTFCYFLHNRLLFFFSFHTVEANVLDEWHYYEISWSPSYLYPHILKTAFGTWFGSSSSTAQAAAAVIWSHSSVSLSSFPSSAGGDSQAIHPESCW